MKVDKLIEALEQPGRELAALTGIDEAPHHPCFVKGYYDAQIGSTTNPYGTPHCRDQWNAGYDFADEGGWAILPRFGKLVAGKSRNRRG